MPRIAMTENDGTVILVAIVLTGAIGFLSVLSLCRLDRLFARNWAEFAKEFGWSGGQFTGKLFERQPVSIGWGYGTVYASGVGGGCMGLLSR